MISSLFLLLLMQSANPYGSPIDPLLRPADVRPPAPANNPPAPTPAPVAIPKSPQEIRFNQCVDQATDDPSSGVIAANRWQIEGGGYLARHCLGYAYAELLDWSKAVPEFVKAAEGAGAANDDRAANFWAQAGNAALAKGDYPAARAHLSAALQQNRLEGLPRGEVHLDLARVAVAMEQYDEAKAQFTYVHQLAPQDPLSWLLSATLARRMGDLALAKADITKAAKLAGGDPAVALEAGNIAYAAGDTAGAKKFWQQAVQFDAASAPAEAASTYLARLAGDDED
ncbi:tetratricopeptide repeat protein [Parasphingorhabdus sp.]|jgi:tetratricopeptide (TPR) repeat protein|uniref:tetratricopeptide repeat protein n=1 Tax=Parasphingorhabdus sp. TaxID=2709688 RepID=UPI0009EE604D